MIGIFTITNSKLAGWTFGVDLKELKAKVIILLEAEESQSRREELREVLH